MKGLAGEKPDLADQVILAAQNIGMHWKKWRNIHYLYAGDLYHEMLHEQ